jgi:diguanylate cyclase (GGDEF)-like protein
MAEKKLRVLLVGSALQALVSPLNAACSQMQHALDLTSVSSLETMLAIVKIIPLDVLILDLSLAPGVNDALRLIHRAAPNVPLITFATAAHKEAACATIKDGAIGYLLSENLELTAITPLLSAALERNTVRGLVDLLRDSLTNLYTREGFQTLGVRALESSRSDGRNTVLLCALLDNLSTLRSKFGAAGADRALTDIAEMFISCFRDADLIARIGDGHFAVLALNASAPSAPLLLQRLQKRLALLNQAAASEPIELRFSVGISASDDQRSFAEFLDAVESALRHPTTPAAR